MVLRVAWGWVCGGKLGWDGLTQDVGGLKVGKSIEGLALIWIGVRRIRFRVIDDKAGLFGST